MSISLIFKVKIYQRWLKILQDIMDVEQMVLVVGYFVLLSLTQEWIINNLQCYYNFGLGVKICPDNIDCRYCGRKMDRYAHHAIQCMRGPHMVKRHNQVRNFLYKKNENCRVGSWIGKKNIYLIKITHVLQISLSNIFHMAKD